MSGFPPAAERGRGEIVQRTMRPLVVVVPAPALGDNVRFQHRPEGFQVEALVTEVAVETFAKRILPGRTGINVVGVYGLVVQPGHHGLGDKLRPIVTAHEGGRPAPAGRLPPTNATTNQAGTTSKRKVSVT